MEDHLLKENKDAWKKVYADIPLSNQLLDLVKHSPENFIDDLKMNYLSKYLPKEGIIVEVGAGSGRLITRIGVETKKCKLIGIDYETSATIIVKKNIEQFNLNGTSICADVFYIPIKSNSVDVVISGGLLEHFNKDEINSVIREMVRILKPNGFFYSDIVPNKMSLCRPIRLSHRGGYENSFSKNQWRKILSENGLMSIDIMGSCILPTNFYCWFKSGVQLELMYKLQPYINNFDDTILSDIFGFMYYVFAKKQIENKE